MNVLEHFNKCTTGPWETIGHLQFKLDDGTLYFQCSNGKEDWVSNFFCIPARYDGEWVHKGFRDMWLPARDIISKLKFNVVVGYSQGGPFANWAYKDVDDRKVICITYGSPKFILHPSEKAKLEYSSVCQFKNTNDIVTTQPRLFTHVGKEFTLPDAAERPSGYSRLLWASGHCPEMYRQNLHAFISL